MAFSEFRKSFNCISGSENREPKMQSELRNARLAFSDRDIGGRGGLALTDLACAPRRVPLHLPPGTLTRIHREVFPTARSSDRRKQWHSNIPEVRKERFRSATPLLTYHLDSTSSSSFTPRKRRIACASYNDENIDPKSVQDEEVDVINKRQIVLEDLEDPFGASRCETIAITKSATGRERIALSTPGLNRKSRKGRLIESE